MVVKQKNGPLSWFRRHRFISFVFLISVLVLGVFIFRSYQKHQNKLAFEEARSSIDQVFKGVVEKVGKPDNVLRYSSCSRPNQEWTQGPLSCQVSTDFIYGVKDRGEATLIYKKIQSYISTKENLLKPVGPLSSAITDELIVNSYYHSAYDKYKTKRGMDCSIKYVYDTPEDSFLDAPSGKKGLYISSGCNDGAKDTYYPIEN